MKLEGIVCFMTPGSFGSFISIFTYMNRVRLYFCVDKAIVYDENVFIKYIEKEIDLAIQSVKLD